MATTTPTAAAVNALVAKWSAKHPDLADRLERAAALVDNVTATVSPDLFKVEGSFGHQYVVRVNRAAKTSTCTCPDHQKRIDRCKHILAAAFHEAARA